MLQLTCALHYNTSVQHVRLVRKQRAGTTPRHSNTCASMPDHTCARPKHKSVRAWHILTVRRTHQKQPSQLGACACQCMLFLLRLHSAHSASTPQPSHQNAQLVACREDPATMPCEAGAKRPGSTTATHGPKATLAPAPQRAYSAPPGHTAAKPRAAAGEPASTADGGG